MINFTMEDPIEIEDEIRQLLPAHLAEFSFYPDPPFKPAPNFPVYRHLARNSLLYVVTARDKGRLVAYALVTPAPDLHHEIEGHPVALSSVQAWYILPEWRAKIAKSFFGAVETAAAMKKADIVGVRTRPGRGAFLSSIGYVLAEEVWVKPMRKLRIEASDA